jgi:hypothetical protein
MPKPLDGVRILALEQMQALPFATQLLSHLGADVVKVEHPKTGDSGRGALPAVADTDGRQVGATYLRNNLGKRSIAIDLKHPEGKALIKRLVPRYDAAARARLSPTTNVGACSLRRGTYIGTIYPSPTQAHAICLLPCHRGTCTGSNGPSCCLPRRLCDCTAAPISTRRMSRQRCVEATMRQF